MSWSTNASGKRADVKSAIRGNILQSGYGATPEVGLRLFKIADATDSLIDAALPPVEGERDLTVSCWGHADAQGMSNYGLEVAYVDPAD